MATAIVRARRNVLDGTCKGEPLKVIYSKKEPSRKYVWAAPNGGYYVWNGHKWVPRTCHCRKEEPKQKCCEDYVTKNWAESKLNNLRRDLVEKMKKLIPSGGSSEGINELQEYVESQVSAINNEITRLNSVDTSVNQSIQNLNDVDTITNERLESLEAHDTMNCVTAVDV